MSRSELAYVALVPAAILVALLFVDVVLPLAGVVSPAPTWKQFRLLSRLV
jgi:hypothetical protein